MHPEIPQLALIASLFVTAGEKLNTHTGGSDVGDRRYFLQTCSAMEAAGSPVDDIARLFFYR